MPVLFASAEAPPLFALLAVMLVGVVIVSLLLHRVRQSLLVGYFLCGVVIANSGLIDHLGSDNSQDAVAQMAEFGIMLLMFVLGLEFSISELRYLRRFALLGGSLQMAICGLTVLGAAIWLGLGWPAAIVLGVALAMSSTAVSLKTFQDMDLWGTPAARFALGIAIFQDLFIIVFLVFLPILTDGGLSGGGLLRDLGLLLGRGAAFGVVAVVFARGVIPILLRSVARTRQRELFTLTVVGCCVGLAWVATLCNLSLALGAFVAGLAVSESIYKHRIMAEILPIKDLFLTLFFVSVGLVIDLDAALGVWEQILLLTAVLILLKSIAITGIAYGLGQRNRTAWLAGFALSSAGEFSLLLLQRAGRVPLFAPDLQQALIAAAALSMGLLPSVMRLGEPLGAWLDRRGWGRRRASKPKGLDLHDKVQKITGHAILCGHGPTGAALNSALLDAGISTLVIELNVDTVHQLMHRDQPVLFADANDEITWQLAHLDSALLVAFTFPDSAAAGNALRIIRERQPEITVVARARFATDEIRLLRLGANIVIRDEAVVGRAMVENALRVINGSAAEEPEKSSRKSDDPA